MTPDEMAAQFEANLTAEDKARLAAMPDGEREEFYEFMREDLRERMGRIEKKSGELVALAKAHGVNVDGSKGVQFLLGLCSGLIITVEDLQSKVNEQQEYLGSKMAAKKFLDGWKKRAAEKDKEKTL